MVTAYGSISSRHASLQPSNLIDITLVIFFRNDFGRPSQCSSGFGLSSVSLCLAHGLEKGMRKNEKRHTDLSVHDAACFGMKSTPPSKGHARRAGTRSDGEFSFLD